VDVLEEEETGFLKSVLEESDEDSRVDSDDATTDTESAVHSYVNSQTAGSAVGKDWLDFLKVIVLLWI